MGFADSRLFGFEGRKIETERGLFNPHGDFDAANAEMCRRIGRKLMETYPGHPWGVSSEIEHGIVKVMLQGFPQWPMVIHVETLKSDPGLRSVVKWAGEILERLGMPRKGFSSADWRRANTIKPWHFNRNSKAPEAL